MSPPGARHLALPALLGHAAVVSFAAAVAFGVYTRAYFVGLRSSDGANYATVARNVANGRGLVSSVVQPGLVDVAATSREGQAFIIQAPLWPVALGQAFRIFGARESTILGVSAVLFCAVVVEAWWLAYVASGGVLGAAYVAVLLVVTNPHLIGAALAATNVLLQALLLGAVLIVATKTPRVATAALLGLLLGVALVTRENSIFLMAAVIAVWRGALGSEAADPSAARPGRRRGATLIALTAVALAVAFVPLAWEAARKAAVIGRPDAPVLRMTFLYHTPVADQGWYFVYRHPMLSIDPAAYFWSHPGELVRKAAYQISTSFAKETLPSLMAGMVGFVPLVAPPVVPSALGRRAAWGILATVALQVLVGSLSFLNFTYFFAFVPLLAVMVAATAAGFWARAAAARTRARRGAALVLAAYAVAPALVNPVLFAAGRPPVTGDYHMAPATERALAHFIQATTERSAVITCAHSALMAWDTGRTIVMYSVHPLYTVGDTPMWRALDARLGIDYILLSTLASETPDRPLPHGFRLVATSSLGDGGQAWLFGRPRAGGP